MTHATSDRAKPAEENHLGIRQPGRSWRNTRKAGTIADKSRAGGTQLPAARRVRFVTMNSAIIVGVADQHDSMSHMTNMCQQLGFEVHSHVVDSGTSLAQLSLDGCGVFVTCMAGTSHQDVALTASAAAVAMIPRVDVRHDWTPETAQLELRRAVSAGLPRTGGLR